MAEGASTATANSILDWLYGTLYAQTWIQLHVGAPGSAGTANPAANTTRQQITSFAAASGGVKASSAAVTWTSVPAAETYSKQSNWTASTSGTFEDSGPVTASAVNIGDTFTIPSGQWTATLPTAS
jgi:hypothetical protein